MKTIIILFIFFLSISLKAQNEYLAQNYYDRGEYEKAIINYEELLKNSPNNYTFISKLIDCYQQMKNFEKAGAYINTLLKNYQDPQFYVELGYNYQLQKKQVEAEKNYEQAIKKVATDPNYTYNIASTFEKKSLLEYALKTYQTGIAKNPEMNLNFQLGLLYGQMGKTDLMIEFLMKEAYENSLNVYTIQSYFTRFMQNDSEDIFTNSLKKVLILASQKNQEVFYNEMLSWFFTDQKDFKNAFIQEKAIYKKKQENFNNLFSIGEYAINEEKIEIANEIFEYIKSQTNEKDTLLRCNYYLLKIKVENNLINKNEIVSDFEALISANENYDLIEVKIAYANYLAFKNIDIEKAIEILKKEINKPNLLTNEVAKVKLELANIMVYNEKFNKALLLYSQVEEDMKNDELAHQASYKIAKTSYFKEDFEWALAQLKILKSASSQLIANDALELYLLINDNILTDTTYTALKKFAKADYLIFKKKQPDALKIFEEILKTHSKEAIVDAAVYRIATIYQETENYSMAITTYEKLLSEFQESIYRDEALYFAGNIYSEKLNLPEKAKEMYEKIIINHKDSIYFTDARNNYRKLRGDKLL